MPPRNQLALRFDAFLKIDILLCAAGRFARKAAKCAVNLNPLSREELGQAQPPEIGYESRCQELISRLFQTTASE